MQRPWFVLSFLLTSAAFSPANASLTKSDFFNPGDGLLITDTFTNLQWLTPVYTQNHTYGDSFVLSLEAAYGFRYATGAEATAMINNNFGNPPTSSPGTTAGYTDATNFMNLFGVAEWVTCGGSPCPRTQGLTSSLPYNGSHYAFGMITVGSLGYAIFNNTWLDVNSDTQLGSFLVRPTPTPEPASAWLIGAGVSLLAWLRRAR